MLFVRRQFEMHKRNSHIIRGTLNSTVTRVPSPFPHPVASVYLFLSLSPSFCLSVCPYFPLSVDHLSGQPRNFGHFGVRLHSNWKHMSNGWLISSFNLHSPPPFSPSHTHTYTLALCMGGTFEKRWQAFVPSCCEDEKSCSSYYSNAFQQLPHRNPFLIFHGGRPCPASLLSLKVQRKQKANRGGARDEVTLSHTLTLTHTYTMHMHIAEGSVEHI